MAVEKESYLEWYDSHPPEATQSVSSVDQKTEKVEHFSPYPSQEETAAMFRYIKYAGMDVGIEEYMKGRYDENGLPRTPSAKCFDERNERARSGRNGSLPTSPPQYPVPTLPDHI